MKPAQHTGEPGKHDDACVPCGTQAGPTNSDRQQDKVALGYQAVRADPVFGDVLKASAGGNAGIGVADAGVVDPAANLADYGGYAPS